MDVKLQSTYGLGKQAIGVVTAMLFDPITKAISQAVTNRNKIMYGGADVMASRLVSNEAPPVNMMYLEFANVTPPSPTYDRAGGLAYYRGLGSNHDILRVPLIVTPTVSSTNQALYDGNNSIFISVSEASQGKINALGVVDGVSSFYGAALVAAADPADLTKDKVFSRVYFTNALVKTTGKQICTIWNIEFS